MGRGFSYYTVLHLCINSDNYIGWPMVVFAITTFQKSCRNSVSWTWRATVYVRSTSRPPTLEKKKSILLSWTNLSSAPFPLTSYTVLVHRLSFVLEHPLSFPFLQAIPSAIRFFFLTSFWLFCQSQLNSWALPAFNLSRMFSHPLWGIFIPFAFYKMEPLAFFLYFIDFFSPVGVLLWLLVYSLIIYMSSLNFWHWPF